MNLECNISSIEMSEITVFRITDVQAGPFITDFRVSAPPQLQISFPTLKTPEPQNELVLILVDRTDCKPIFVV